MLACNWNALTKRVLCTEFVQTMFVRVIQGSVKMTEACSFKYMSQITRCLAFVTVCIVFLVISQVDSGGGNTCYRPLCPSEWVQYRDSCYYYVDEGKNYLDAEQFCYSLSYNIRKSHLTSANDEDEVIFLTDLTRSSSSASSGGVPWVWIGYDDLDVEGTFVWQDGGQSTWVNWNGYPDNSGGIEHCVHMYVDTIPEGKWNDLGCSNTMAFICKMRQR